MSDADRMKMVVRADPNTRETVTPRALPTLPPLDIKRVARPSEPRGSPTGSSGVPSPLSGGNTPVTPDNGNGGRRRKRKVKKGRHQDEVLSEEFRALGMNSPVPASQPDHEDEGSEGDGSSPFPAITVDKCEDEGGDGGGGRKAHGAAQDLNPDSGAGGLWRRDSDLLSPTPPLHRRSLDNKYTIHQSLSSSRSDGCLEYLGNIQVSNIDWSIY